MRFKRGRDPLSGKVFYTNTMNHKVQFTQPLIIGKHHWDPDDITQVRVFSPCVPSRDIS